MEIDEVDQAGNDTPPPEDKPSNRPKGKSAAKPSAGLVRESGKSLLPLSRVQKIMKADRVHASSRSTRIVFDVVFRSYPLLRRRQRFLYHWQQKSLSRGYRKLATISHIARNE